VSRNRITLLIFFSLSLSLSLSLSFSLSLSSSTVSIHYTEDLKTNNFTSTKMKRDLHRRTFIRTLI